jgi:Mce-associated membrane protein
VKSGATSTVTEPFADADTGDAAAEWADEQAYEEDSGADSPEVAESEDAESEVADPDVGGEDASDTEAEHSEGPAPGDSGISVAENSGAEDADKVADSATPTRPVGAAAVRATSKRPLTTASVFVALTAVCIVLAVWFALENYQLRDEGPAANQALVDPGTTSDVSGQITTDIQNIFSYNFANTGKTDNAAKNVLEGPAVQQYQQLFATVQKLAPQEKLILTTTVRSSAVTMLQGDRAEVLLFVDQNAVRTDNGQNNVGPAQITVTTVRQGSQWKITQITQH